MTPCPDCARAKRCNDCDLTTIELLDKIDDLEQRLGRAEAVCEAANVWFRGVEAYYKDNDDGNYFSEWGFPQHIKRALATWHSQRETS